MNVKTLKKMLRQICDAGYAEWIPRFYPPDGGHYSINHIYIDDDGDICLQSSDYDDDPYQYTVWYLEEEYDDESTDAWDIEFNWYTDTYTDDDGDEVEELYIDCCEMD